MNYYNDNDVFVCAWLRNLIAAKLIPNGEVDERPIQSVTASDVGRFRQCHFFAGIGGWPFALDLAGWSRERAIWTASCPCQPFSVAGRRAGVDDSRHLWPEFLRLVRDAQPTVVVGEQVASKDGRGWLSGVRADLEELGYAVGGADLCAAGVGAPHIRQRIYWMAHAALERHAAGNGESRSAQDESRSRPKALRSGSEFGLADSSSERLEGFGAGREADGAHVDVARGTSAGGGDASSGLGDADGNGFAARLDEEAARHRHALAAAGWGDAEYQLGADGKTRRVKPGIRLLAHGIPARVGRLRGFGNSIVPQVAATFVSAVMDCIPE